MIGALGGGDGMDQMTADRPADVAARTEEELRGLVERAREGDSTALPAVQRALDENPHLWQAYGDLAALAEESWRLLIAGKDLVLFESLGRKLAALRAELLGP